MRLADVNKGEDDNLSIRSKLVGARSGIGETHFAHEFFSAMPPLEMNQIFLSEDICRREGLMFIDKDGNIKDFRAPLVFTNISLVKLSNPRLKYYSSDISI